MATWIADDGTPIHFEFHDRSSKSPVLLLLPGLLGSINNQWHIFVAPFLDDFRIIRVDLRGHGLSGNQAPNLMPERMVQDLFSLLDHLDIGGVHIAGYSLGGYLGLMMHLSQPGRIRSLLLHASKFYWSKHTASQMREQLNPERMTDQAPAYANQLALDHGANRWRALVRQAADLASYLAENGITETNAALAQCPVLVSVGDRDELVTVREAQRLSRVFHQGALMVLPGVRHPFPSANPLPLLSAMRIFFEADTSFST